MIIRIHVCNGTMRTYTAACTALSSRCGTHFQSRSLHSKNSVRTHCLRTKLDILDCFKQHVHVHAAGSMCSGVQAGGDEVASHLRYVAVETSTCAVPEAVYENDCDAILHVAISNIYNLNHC